MPLREHAFFKKIHWTPLFLEFFIFAVGIFNLWSATSVEDKSLGLYKTQLLWFILGLLASGVVLFFHMRFFARMAYLIYFANIVLLIAVLFLGSSALGAKRWLTIGHIGVQPSEFMKLSFLLALARWIERTRRHEGYDFLDLLPAVVLFAIPALLIVLQPDLGTAVILALSFLTVMLFVKVKTKVVLTASLAALLAAPLMYHYGLKPYQKKRIMAFLDPLSDPRGTGWNTIQSMIAVGSGKIFGKGFQKSTQSKLNFLPEHHTDFIFSVFAEEHGFVGCLLVLALYLIFCLYALSIASQAHDIFSMVLGVGLFSVFFWHTVLNIAMVVGLMPVVGIPLPFLSYGGSSLVSMMLAVALLTNVASKRRMF